MLATNPRKTDWRMTPIADLHLDADTVLRLEQAGLDTLYDLLEWPSASEFPEITQALSMFYELHPDVAEAIERDQSDDADDEARARRDPKMQRFLEIKRAKRAHLLAKQAYLAAKAKADKLRHKMLQAERRHEELWQAELDMQQWLF